jgi:hypothetical protein
VVSNTVNSNTINLVFGLVLPSLVIGMGRAAGDGVSTSGGCWHDRDRAPCQRDELCGREAQKDRYWLPLSLRHPPARLLAIMA